MNEFSRQGILFDVLQCLIQRNFTYATDDIRRCYTIIKQKLYQPNLTKVIFILHSQGGIEGGLIVDWLLQEVPQDLLSKLEIYTFGNAANHFNNPHLHLLSQTAALKEAQKPKPNGLTPEIHYRDAPPTLQTSLNDKTRRKHHTTSPNDKTIRYIEHYAHTLDFVAQWGVLHFTSLSLISSPLTPRFMGRVFERQGRGHQMNQHYLDSMFPLKKAPCSTGGIGGSGFIGVDLAACEVEGGFMGSALDLTPDDKPEKKSKEKAEQEDDCGAREDLESSIVGAHGSPLSSLLDYMREGEDENEVLLRDMSPNSTFHILRHGFTSSSDGSGSGSGSGAVNRNVNGDGDGGMEEMVNGVEERTVKLKVKDLSRLWLYVNGRSPRADEMDFKVARMSTM
jgi:hypothetical protein